MGELQPLRDDLPEPVAALAAGMRELFKALEISLTRFAARVHVDKSNVSRYLSGRTVPPWQFVHQLMVEATLAQSGLEEPTQDVVDRFFALHCKAHVADDSPAGHITRLRDQLAVADLEVSRAQRNERRIESELEITRRQIAELKVSKREIEARRDADVRARLAENVVLHSGMNDLIEERARLLNKVAELRAELELVQQMRAEAERECESLERDLDSAEQRAVLEKEDLRAFASAQRERAEKLEQHVADLEMSLYTETLVLADAVETPKSPAEQPKAWAELLSQVDSERSAAVLIALGAEEAAQIIHEMSPYEAMVALAHVAPSAQSSILQHVPRSYQRMIWNRLRG